MCAGQVRPSLRFGSEYEVPELGVADVAVVALAVVAVNVQGNHASRIRVREAGLQMETVVYNSPRPGTECD